MNADIVCFRIEDKLKYGTTPAILLFSLNKKFDYYYKHNQLDDEGYFFSSTNDISKSTGLTKREIEYALKILVKAGVVSYRVKGLPPKRYFFLYPTEEILNSDNLSRTKATNCINQKQQIVSIKSDNLSLLLDTNCYQQEQQIVSNIKKRNKNSNKNSNKKEREKSTNESNANAFSRSLDQQSDQTSKPINPTIQEIQSYFEAIGLNQDAAKNEASKFYDYYEAVGWLVKGQPIIKWQNCANGWLKKINIFKERKKTINQMTSDEFVEMCVTDMLKDRRCNGNRSYEEAKAEYDELMQQKDNNQEKQMSAFDKFLMIEDKQGEKDVS